MKELQLYLYNYNTREAMGSSVLAEFHKEIKKLDLDDYTNLNSDSPALFLLRNPKDEPRLWEYVRTVRVKKMNAAFLFLIDQKNFELLYGACRHGITAVLMEPATGEEMEQQLNRCLERIAEVTQMLSDRAKLEEYEYAKHQRIMERILAHLLEKPQEVEFLLPEINRRYELNFGEQAYQAFVISVDHGDLCSKTSHFLKEATLHGIHRMSLAKEIIIGYKEPYGLIGIVYYGEEIPLEKRKKDYESLYQSILGMRGYYGEFQITIGVGTFVESIAEIPNSLARAAFTQEYRMTTGEYLLYAEELQQPKNINEYVPERKIRELLRFVTLGDVRHINTWFLEFYQNVEPRFLEYPPAFAKFCWEVYRGLTQTRSEKTAEIPEWKFLKLQHIFDGKERNRALEQILIESAGRTSRGDQEEQDVATKAIAYMKAHYSEPINLEELAEECSLSTSYFSKKFKEQTGEKYIDVLTDIRIREAQRLLGTTELAVSQIVEEVGYCDEKHFRRIFHKVTGMNPLAYRKKLQKENK